MKKMLGMLDESEKASPEKLKAKMEVLKELRAMMSGMMKDKMMSDADELKKVTVAAPSEEGLKAGLDKAKEVVEQLPELEEAAESSEEESMEEKEEEDVESQIAELEAKLSELKMKKHMS